MYSPAVRDDAGVMGTTRLEIARAAILAQLVFVGGWLVIGALEVLAWHTARLEGRT